MSDVMQQIAAAQSGDAVALEQIIRDNYGLIKSIAVRFRDRGCEFDDLCQIGTIGMIKAVRNFDLSHGTMFSTYAVPLITGEIKKFLRDDGIIKVSRDIKRRGVNIACISERLQGTLGREPTVGEIASEAGITPEEVAEAITATTAVMSFSDPVGEVELGDLLGTDHIDELCESLALRQAIGSLDRDERKLIYYRYYNDMSQANAGKAMGMTQVKVSRMEKKILQKLKDALT